jgi:hypothetical protein
MQLSNPRFGDLDHTPVFTRQLIVLGLGKSLGSQCGAVSVNPSMAPRAEGDQIVLGIGTGLAAKLFVVNLKIGHRSARLASPAVPAEHLAAKLIVRFGIQAYGCALWLKLIHEVFSVA